jgi:glyoxylase-like metal-dependent hydrolase (beta-lactamase superfamily II)
MTNLPHIEATDEIVAPTTYAPYPVGDGITVVPSYLPVPGMGVLPANAYLIDGPEPMLVDTGPGGAADGFTRAVASVIDPTELRWLWLTHTDPDHTGALSWLLDAAPRLRVITTYLAVGKLGMQMVVPMDRLRWVNPGTSIEVNGRQLEAMRPPTFDAPETTAFFDRTARALFPADSFGSVLARPAGDAGDVARGDLADGMALWSTIDSPWAVHTDRGHFTRTLRDVRALDARRVLSAHLPPAEGLTDTLIEDLAQVPGRAPWVAPDDAVLQALLAQGAEGPR